MKIAVLIDDINHDLGLHLVSQALAGLLPGAKSYSITLVHSVEYPKKHKHIKKDDVDGTAVEDANEEAENEEHKKLDEAGEQVLENAFALVKSFHVTYFVPASLLRTTSHSSAQTDRCVCVLQHSGGSLPNHVHLESQLIAGHDSKQKLVAYLDEQCFTTVYVGRRGVLTRAMLGSFSQYIIEHCACNITVVSMKKTETHGKGVLPASKAEELAAAEAKGEKP
eukprot:CAMPEP_0184718970 /NCGR_PEP_ID=MMETSP0314-20130426/8007_1 /TAXON_ID=38298 /ORGANISM="Rhodella maculata, Strain CCMP 736" /LENGTH=222 /DNA_ID=CAMNT_0027182793 /DNA_START=76 /DNA_END=744 /DNA_ORIENTATION=-